MQVIGIGGQARSGKDTLGDYLQKSLSRHTGTIWNRASFANSVKKCFCDYFGQTPEFIEEWKVKDEIPPGFLMPVRKALQFIGDGFRQIQANIWIETCFRLNKAPFIISDARYINEGKAVRRHGGFNILMWRPGYENNDPNPSESQIKPLIDYCVNANISGPLFTRHSDVVYLHAPEGLYEYDWFMRNEGGTGDLYQNVERDLIPALLSHFAKQGQLQGAA